MHACKVSFLYGWRIRRVSRSRMNVGGSRPVFVMTSCAAGEASQRMRACASSGCSAVTGMPAAHSVILCAPGGRSPTMSIPFKGISSLICPHRGDESKEKCHNCNCCSTENSPHSLHRNQSCAGATVAAIRARRQAYRKLRCYVRPPGWRALGLGLACKRKKSPLPGCRREGALGGR